VTAVPQRLDALEAALAAEGGDPASFAGAFEAMRRHFRRWASLEKELLGGVTIPDFPNAVELMETALDAAGIERLARTERERLRAASPETDNLMTLLDREGIKVYRPPFSEGTVTGVFLFDPEVGPAMTVASGLDTASANAAFARLLGHYLIDNDPYRIRFAGIEPPDAVSARAAAFGGAFLVGGDLLRGYLAARKTASPEADAVLELAAYFEAPPALVVARLVDTGVIAAQAGDALLRSLPPAPAEADPGRTQVSERFTRLALEAHARGMLTASALAEHLETDEATARELASRFRLSAE
jgi:hypothetical protein